MVGAGGDRWQLMERDKINQRKIIIRERQVEMERSIICYLKNRVIDEISEREEEEECRRSDSFPAWQWHHPHPPKT